MKLKPKTVRRVLLLAGGVILTSAAVVSFAMVRSWQAERTLERLRQDGMAAAARGDHAAVINLLGSYLKKQQVPEDPGVLLAYANARRLHESADGSHVTAAIRLYDVYLRQREDKAAARVLLKLYNQAGLYSDARDHARHLRPAALEQVGPGDLDVLREELYALGSMRAGEGEIMPVAQRGAELDPLDLQFSLTIDGLLRQGGRAEEANARAQRLAQQFPDDPRPKLVLLLSTVDPSRPATLHPLKDRLCELAGLDPGTARVVAPAKFPDEMYALRLADLLDALEQYDHASAVLREGATALKTPRLVGQAARRLWQSGRGPEVLALVEGMDLTVRLGQQVPAADLVGLVGLSSRLAGLPERATQMRAVLESRRDEFRARAWACVLDVDADRTDLPARLRELRQAEKDLPREPVIAHYLGETLWSLGRSDEAIADWEQAGRSPLAGAWATPWIRLTQAYLSMGLVSDAVQSANTAIARAPRSVQAGIAKLNATVARTTISREPDPDVAAMEAFAASALEQVGSFADPGVARALADEIVPARALLLWRLGRQGEARDLARRWTEGEPSLTPDGLQRLASFSLANGMGVHAPAIESALRQGGQTPGLALLQARSLAQQGRAGEGLAMLKALAERTPEGDRKEWERVVASFLEAVGDPDAGPAWAKLADSYPDDTALQRSALQSPASSDAAFVERIASRLSARGGGEETPSAALRIARARALLSGDVGVRSRDEALAILRGVTNDFPNLLEARLLIVDALLLENSSRGLVSQPDKAILQLSAAASVAISPGPIRLRLAELLQREQSFDRSREELRLLARENPTDRALRRRCAELLAAQGEDALALEIVDAMATPDAEPGPSLVLFQATLLEHTGALDRAASAYERVASLSPEPEYFAPLAAALIRLDRKDRAEQLLSSAQVLALPEPRRLVIRGKTAELIGAYEQAIEHYISATRADAGSGEAWSALVSLEFRAGRLDDAERDLARALDAAPDHADLEVLRQQLLVSREGVSALDGLAKALEKDRTRLAEGAVVRAIKDLAERGKLADPRELTDLARRFPHVLPVQNLVASQLLALQPPQAELAAKIAQRSMATFYTSPDPARLATLAYTTMGRWQPALAAARSWRDREPVNRREPDLSLAQGQFALGQLDLADATLARLVPEAISDPARPFSLAVLDLFLRTRLAMNDPDGALGAVQSLVRTSPEFRREAFLPSAADMAPEGVALRWIEQGARASTDAFEDQLALARAFSTLASRSASSGKDLAARALEILNPIAAERGSTNPEVLELLAMTLHRDGKFEQAATIYRDVLKQHPARVPTLVNLASLLRADPAARDEALRLAERAHEASGGVNASVGSFLAELLVEQAEAGVPGKGASLAAAERASEILAGLLEQRPEDLALHVRLARALALAQRFTQSAEVQLGALLLPGLDSRLRGTIENNAAFAIFRSGDPSGLERAESLARDALKHAPSPDVACTLAHVLSARRNRHEAIAVLRDVLRERPGHPEASLSLADLLVQGSPAERDEATDLVRKLLDAPPNGRVPAWQEPTLERLRERLRLRPPGDAPAPR